ncbi:PREDICTED: acetylcholine receptor subunit alpha-like 1 [Nicrophorus vespilloides]|uniref:Acetylcholine receptor subunit alpha-like 1 n=1 Tax=Nicrophorus vespilloides TaxID=110193 RepID=A0ABM1M6Y6_NICVS|nr:PREDICTED: acetylcholine receptor subunit alpha-like 1 [Nicrophorus vespilloides]
MRVPAQRNEKFYSCCEEPYPDIIFNITLRRKTLFYTVNLIIPCVGISFLSILVFYLPSDSGEKVSLSISILLSLTVFFLLLVEIIPPTSITVPLLGKYLLFTMLLCTLSVVITIAVLNVNFRSPVTHKLAPWVRYFFIGVLPKFLFIERPQKDDDEDDNKGSESVLTDVIHVPSMLDKCKSSFDSSFDLGIPPPSRFDVAASGGMGPCFGEPPFPAMPLSGGDDELYSPASCRTNTLEGISDGSPSYDKMVALHDMEKTIADSKFIAQHVKNKDKFENVEEDWKYVAMVLDRLFLWIFTLACVIGTAMIIFKAPSLYDSTKPIDILISKVAKKKMALLKMVPEEL